jgi:conjugal transfer/entry exclusion protein
MTVKLKTRRFNRAWLVNQLKTNLVALISLVTALAGLSYNSWRNHQNEINNNMRNAAFVVLSDLGELQTIVNYAHFESDNARGNPIDGWKHVIMVRDLSRLLKPDAKKAGETLYVQWQSNWQNIDQDKKTESLISNQIASTRKAVLSTIDSLE